MIDNIIDLNQYREDNYVDIVVYYCPFNNKIQLVTKNFYEENKEYIDKSYILGMGLRKRQFVDDLLETKDFVELLDIDLIQEKDILIKF